MSVEPVEPKTKPARNPWKIATIVLAVLMGLGLVVAAVGAAIAFHHNDSGYGMRNGQPCMGQGKGGMGQGKGGMGQGKGGMGGGKGDMGRGKGGMGMGQGGMGPGYGPVIIQNGGPAGAGAGCIKVANPDGSVSVTCFDNQQGVPLPAPMASAVPVPTGDVTQGVIWSGPVMVPADASPSGDMTPVVVYSMAPADATPGDTISYQVTMDQAPGAPGYRFCTFDGQTTTCSDGMGAQPMPMDQSGCSTDNGSTVCWGTAYGTSQGSWDGYGYKGSTRMMMPGMALIAGGMLVTFLTALAALILAILAFRRARRRPALVTEAAKTPATPVVTSEAAPVVVTDAAAADLVKAESVVAPIAEATAAEPVKAEPVVAPIAEPAPAPAAPKVRRTRR